MLTHDIDFNNDNTTQASSSKEVGDKDGDSDGDEDDFMNGNYTSRFSCLSKTVSLTFFRYSLVGSRRLSSYTIQHCLCAVQAAVPLRSPPADRRLDP